MKPGGICLTKRGSADGGGRGVGKSVVAGYGERARGTEVCRPGIGRDWRVARAFSAGLGRYEHLSVHSEAGNRAHLCPKT